MELIAAGIGGAIGGAILLGYFFKWNVIAIIIGAIIGALGFIYKEVIAPSLPPTYEEMEESNRRDRIREEYYRRHK